MGACCSCATTAHEFDENANSVEMQQLRDVQKERQAERDRLRGVLQTTNLDSLMEEQRRKRAEQVVHIWATTEAQSAESDAALVEAKERQRGLVAKVAGDPSRENAIAEAAAKRLKAHMETKNRLEAEAARLAEIKQQGMEANRARGAKLADALSGSSAGINDEDARARQIKAREALEQQKQAMQQLEAHAREEAKERQRELVVKAANDSSHEAVIAMAAAKRWESHTETKQRLEVESARLADIVQQGMEANRARGAKLADLLSGESSSGVNDEDVRARQAKAREAVEKQMLAMQQLEAETREAEALRAKRLKDQIELQRQINEEQETSRRQMLQKELDRKRELHDQFQQAEDLQATLREQQLQAQRTSWEKTVERLRHEQTLVDGLAVRATQHRDNAQGAAKQAIAEQAAHTDAKLAAREQSLTSEWTRLAGALKEAAQVREQTLHGATSAYAAQRGQFETQTRQEEDALKNLQAAARATTQDERRQVVSAARQQEADMATQQMALLAEQRNTLDQNRLTAKAVLNEHAALLSAARELGKPLAEDRQMGQLTEKGQEISSRMLDLTQAHAKRMETCSSDEERAQLHEKFSATFAALQSDQRNNAQAQQQRLNSMRRQIDTLRRDVEQTGAQRRNVEVSSDV